MALVELAQDMDKPGFHRLVAKPGEDLRVLRYPSECRERQLAKSLCRDHASKGRCEPKASGVAGLVEDQFHQRGTDVLHQSPLTLTGEADHFGIGEELCAGLAQG